MVVEAELHVVDLGLGPEVGRPDPPDEADGLPGPPVVLVQGPVGHRLPPRPPELGADPEGPGQVDAVRGALDVVEVPDPVLEVLVPGEGAGGHDDAARRGGQPDVPGVYPRHLGDLVDGRVEVVLVDGAQEVAGPLAPPDALGVEV